ncbi:MAG: type II and III secretion system protein family protein [Paracoccaceae bacterium]
MSIKNILSTGLLGLGLSLTMVSQAPAQGLSVMRGTTSSNISVAVNRAIVVQSDTIFSEVSVANPAIADIATLSENTIYVLGKVPGRTTLTIFGADGSLVANVDVRVVPDIAEFKERLAEILPGEPIQVRTASDGIVLSGTISGARKVARAMELAERYAPGKVTNLMMVGGTQQVMLQVRFAEMQRSVAKSLHSSVGLAGGNFTAGTGVIAQGANMANVGAGGPYVSNNERNGAIGFSFGGGGLAVSVLLEALESKGMSRTLAEPNVVAVSGQKGEFFAGGEYPVLTRGTGIEGTKIEYKRFGVLLEFTPTVIDGNLIRLDLDTTVSALDRNVVAQGVFGFKTRSTKTSVEMRDGQSFAIAGLLQDDFDDTVGQVPWLGDVPILGALFRSSDFARKQSELVVIITPHLVAPTTSDALSMATNHMRIPTEEELFLLGTVEGSSSLGGSSDIQGSYGYVME